ncbi:MAG TPA: phosphatase PAP2 family protein [Polyangiaceae bacterium]|jgi:hypothetical protein
MSPHPFTKSAPPRPWYVRAYQELAVHELLILTFLLILNAAVWFSGPDPNRLPNIARVGGLLALLLVSICLVRGGALDKMPWWRALLYRFGIYGPVQISYFFFKTVLPQVNKTTLDSQLYAFDLKVFGFEPAMALDRFVTHATTEWFAFFYFGYFFLLALHVVPILFFSRRRHILGEFTFAIIMVFCVGHSLYMAVPGYGPYRAMAGAFQHSFPAGLWHDLVMSAVKSGGAQMDIFPSLHTAAPTAVALFSWRNRKELPFRYTWPLVAFCTVNIIIATMFLRWHYLIDVVVGLALAATGVWLSRPVTRWELARRERLGYGAVWPEFTPVPSANKDYPSDATSVA